MITRISHTVLGVVSFAFLALALFASVQFFQPTVADAVACEPGMHPFKLTKSISDNYTPDPYTADEFKFSVTGNGVDKVVNLNEFTVDTAENIVCLPVGTYTVEEIGPDGFEPDDWTLQWSGPGCETEGDGNGPVRPIEITVVETSIDYPGADDVGNACKADNQWRPVTDPDPIPGCMDPIADNYDPAATVDNGSCDYGDDIPGCMDPLAENYNPLATVDNGSCTYDNGNQCVAELQGSWADDVESYDQGLRRDETNVLAARSIATTTLGAVDGNFFSLGFGGEIVVSFDSYVPNVAGNDFTIYEVTNGDSYPEESALVYVSQDATTWYLVGTANNLANDNTSSFDFDSTPLSWINSIKLVDTSDPADFTDEYDSTTMPDGFDLDAIRVSQQVCTEPDDEDGGGDNDGPKWLVYGYVWHDKNESDIWEVEQPNPEDNETDLDGWTVRITNGEVTYSTTTDSTGYYYFYVPAGTWTINEEVQADWSKTFPNVNGHVVEVVGNMTKAEESNFFAMVMNYIVPTAHAAVATTYGPYNFGNVYTGSNSGCTSNCGGGGNGHSTSMRDGNGGGGNNNDDEPEGEVLGEATSVMPVGAPNTGNGGTAPISAKLPVLQAILAKNDSVRKVKNA